MLSYEPSSILCHMYIDGSTRDQKNGKKENMLWLIVQDRPLRPMIIPPAIKPVDMQTPCQSTTPNHFRTGQIMQEKEKTRSDDNHTDQSPRPGDMYNAATASEAGP